MIKLRKLRKQLDTAKTRVHAAQDRDRNKLYAGRKLLEFRGDPEGYVEHVLKGTLTDDQMSLILKVDQQKQRRVFCRSGHLTGKSHALAVLVSYLYDTYEEVLIITTAPRLGSVRDILWRELRNLRRRAGLGGWTGPRSIRLESSPNHLAYGTTARTSTSFQGAHGIRVFVIIDEAVGVEAEFWEAIETLLSGEEFALLAIYNPKTTACQAYTEEQEKGTDVLTISCLNHPNIACELRGERPPYPAAVRLEWVATHIHKWCDALLAGEEPKPTDFVFPPVGTLEGVCQLIEMRAGMVWRPGPIAEARILGRWPSSSVNTFWSEALIDACRGRRLEIKPHWRVAIGCDVARYGDDLTELVVRQGLCVLHHEAHSGWTGDLIAGRIKQLCQLYHGPEEPTQVRVFIDETGGWGTGVIDNRGVGEAEYSFVGINCASKENIDKDLHHNTRAALWAVAVEIAKKPGLGLDLSRLPRESFLELKRQLLAQTYKILPNGAIEATDKDKVKELLGRSPDGADALNLALYSM